jgi:major membrane immunogen (membrane-anchored lipoprotein)
MKPYPIRMKTPFSLIFSLSFFALVSCQRYGLVNCSITDEDMLLLHKLIERTEPDTVKKYISFYIQRYSLPVSVTGYPDGNYSGESPSDDYGYRHNIQFTLESGLISAISYDESKADGHSKQADTSYCRQMNEHTPGSAPSLTYPAYELQFKQKRNLQAMDAISGATYSLYRFQYAAIKAFLNGPEE